VGDDTDPFIAFAHADDDHPAMVGKIETETLCLGFQVVLESDVLRVLVGRDLLVGHRVEADQPGQRLDDVVR
jgi:hypothetical protein